MRRLHQARQQLSAAQPDRAAARGRAQAEGRRGGCGGRNRAVHACDGGEVPGEERDDREFELCGAPRGGARKTRVFMAAGCLLGGDADGTCGAGCDGGVHGDVGRRDGGDADGGLLVVGVDTGGAALLHAPSHREPERDIEVPQRFC